jgi:tetratricopeptide (TPR) repeat protein
MEASIAEDHPPKKARGFAALHRDVWRIAKIAPVIFLVLPAVVWFPIDVLIEVLLPALTLDEWQQVRYSIQLASLAQWIFGSLVVAIQLCALRAMANGEQVRFATALRDGFFAWSQLMGVFFASAWRVGIGFLLLVVPGIYLMVRYALASPVAIFEDKHGSAALEASRDYVKGCGWKVFFVALGSLCLYVPITSAPFFLVPMDAGPLLIAVAGMPTNIAVHLFVVPLALIYADRRRDWFPAAPIGQVDLAAPTAIEPPRTGRRGVWLAGGLSFASLVIAFGFMVVGPERVIAEAEAAYEAGDYELALVKFEEAAESYPDEPYIEYSLGWVHCELGDFRRAERHMARAVELAPEDSDYLLGLANVLVELGRFAEAQTEIDRAEALENPNAVMIEYLRTMIPLSSEEALPEIEADP